MSGTLIDKIKSSVGLTSSIGNGKESIRNIPDSGDSASTIAAVTVPKVFTSDLSLPTNSETLSLTTISSPPSTLLACRDTSCGGSTIPVGSSTSSSSSQNAERECPLSSGTMDISRDPQRETKSEALFLPILDNSQVATFNSEVNLRAAKHNPSGGICFLDRNCGKALQAHTAFDALTCVTLALNADSKDIRVPHFLKIWDECYLNCPRTHSKAYEHNNCKHAKLSALLDLQQQLDGNHYVARTAHDVRCIASRMVEKTAAQEALREKVAKELEANRKKAAMHDVECAGRLSCDAVDVAPAFAGNQNPQIEVGETLVVNAPEVAAAVEKANAISAAFSGVREFSYAARQRAVEAYKRARCVLSDRAKVFVKAGQSPPDAPPMPAALGSETPDAGANITAAEQLINDAQQASDRSQARDRARIVVLNLFLRVFDAIFSPSFIVRYFVITWVTSLLLGSPARIIRDALLHFELYSGFVRFAYDLFTLAEYLTLALAIVKFFSGFESHCIQALAYVLDTVEQLPHVLAPLVHRISNLVHNSVTVRFDAFSFVSHALSRNFASLATSPVRIPDEISWGEYVFIRLVSLVTSASMCVSSAISAAQPHKRIVQQYDRFKEVVLVPCAIFVALLVFWINYLFLSLTLWNCILFAVFSDVTIGASVYAVYHYIKCCEKYSHNHELEKVFKLQSQLESISRSGKLFLDHTAAAVEIESQPETFRGRNEKFNREQRVQSAIAFSSALLTTLGFYYATTNLEKMMLLGFSFCTRMLQTAKAPNLSELGYTVGHAGEENVGVDSSSDAYTVIDGDDMYPSDETTFQLICNFFVDPIGSARRMSWTARTTVVALIATIVGCGLMATLYGLRKVQGRKVEKADTEELLKTVLDAIAEARSSQKMEGNVVSAVASDDSAASEQKLAPLTLAVVSANEPAEVVAALSIAPQVEVKTEAVEAKGKTKNKRKGNFRYDDADTMRKLFEELDIDVSGYDNRQLGSAIQDLFNAYTRAADLSQNWNENMVVDGILHQHPRNNRDRVRLIRSYRDAGVKYEAVAKFYSSYSKNEKIRDQLTAKAEARYKRHFEAATKKRPEAASVNQNLSEFIPKFQDALGIVRSDQEVICNFVLVSSKSGVVGVTVLHAFNERDALTFSIVGRDKVEKSVVVTRAQIVYGNGPEKEKDLAIVDLTSTLRNTGVALPSKYFANVSKNKALTSGKAVTAAFLAMARGENVTPCRAQLLTNQKFPTLQHDASTSVGDCGGVLVTTDRSVTDNIPVVIGMHAWGDRASSANGAYTFDAAFIGHLN
jgi:hypothetical protein